MTWAIVVPRVAVPPRAVPLIGEGFEKPEMKWDAGFPSKAGTWKGDAGQMVGATSGVQPKKGDYILRLDPTEKWHLSYMYRMIDVERKPLPTGDEVREVVVTASFHAATAGAEERYTVRVATFSEAPDEVRNLWGAWQEMDERALTFSKNAVTTLPNAEGWQSVSVTVEVPRGARAVAVSLGAGRFDRSAKRTPHFIDDVRAELRIRPRSE